MSKLVIVESPAKAKNIKGYLGKGYDVVASMGHVRDLPAARLSVDIAHDFAPKYAVIAGKENFVKDLKKKAQAADYVYLATDPDREGEAISWHLATLLGLDMKEKNRVTFNEITKHGVLTGMEHPNFGSAHRLQAVALYQPKNPTGSVCRSCAVRGAAAGGGPGRGDPCF